MTAALQAQIRGVSLIGPGLPDWSEAQRVLRGEAHWCDEITDISPPDVVPARERRRTSPAMRLALNTAVAACDAASVDRQNTASVFSSAVGSGSVTARIFSALTTELKQISPTDFHNSVHNAAAGYWSIGTGCHAPSTSIAAGDYGFGAGLLRALMQVQVEKRDVLYVCFEHPFPEPLHTVRPFGHALGVGLVLSPLDASVTNAEPQMTARLTASSELSRPKHAELSKLCTSAPPGHALALLESLALAQAGTLWVPLSGDGGLEIEIAP